MLKNINFGIKISLENINLLHDIYKNKNIIDFIEVRLPAAFTDEDLVDINNLKLPYAIHLPTSYEGFDIGDINKQKKNNEIIERINQNGTKFQELEPICYIIHPESGDIGLSVSNLKKLKIKPIALENVPLKGLYGYDLIGYDLNSLKIYYEEIPNLKFCLDINHAIKASISLKENYETFIKKLLKFKKPIIMHISGGNLNNDFDEHLALDEGQYDVYKIKEILIHYGSNVNLTFETPRNNEKGIEDDLKNMNLFIEAKNLKD